MNEYEYLTTEEAELVKGFPTLTQDDLRRANDLFQPYIFYQQEKNGDRMLQTTCCHKYERYEGFRQVTDDKHHNFMESGHNDDAECPYCGKAVILKQIGKSGKRKNLRENKQIIFLHTRGDALYVQSYWARKHYEHKNDLFKEPKFSPSTIYRFQIGTVQMFYRDCYDWKWQTRIEQLRIGRMRILEPFRVDGYCGAYLQYHVIGLERLETSAFRYCQYDRWRDRGNMNHATDNFIRYLTVYAIYPKQTEMLVKVGAFHFVEDLVYSGKKNAAVFRWEEENPQKAFGLSKQELREFLRGRTSPSVLLAFKLLRKAGIRQTIPEVNALIERIGSQQTIDLINHCLPTRLRPQKILTYLEPYTGGCHAGGYRSIGSIILHWCDYCDAAVAIGYDLSQTRVALPPDLQESHDTVTATYRRMLQTNEEEEEKRAWEKRLESYARRRNNLQKRYAMISNGLFIRIPESEAEIIQEGQSLEHCVSGYASRHMAGKVTILFLRKVDEPDRSLCTIEMKGNTLVQIHGYKNERKGLERIAPPPRETYASFLDPWLDWLAQGSQRDKNATPILQTKQEVKTA